MAYNDTGGEQFTISHMMDRCYVFEEYIENSDQNMGLTAACSILTAIGFLLSVLLLLLIVTDRSIRYQLFYISVASFTSAHIVLSGLTNPITIHYEATMFWNLGVEACKIWMTADVVLPGLACLILLAVNIDRLLIVSIPDVYTGALRPVPTAVFFLLPWVIAFAVILPAWLSSEEMEKHSEFFIRECNVCVFKGKEEVVNGTVIALFCFPSTMILLVGAVTVFRFIRWNPAQRRQPSVTFSASSTGNNTSISRPLESRQAEMASEEARMNRIVVRHLTKPTIQAVSVVNLLFIGMWLPSQMTHIAPGESIGTNQLLVWIGPMNVIVSSFILLLLPAVRKNLPKIICKKVAWPHRFSLTANQALEEGDISCTSNDHNTTYV